MNYEKTEVVFVVEKSITLKQYLNELLDAYITPAVTYFAGGISEENDVFFTQSSLVRFALVFFGSEFSLLGPYTQIETFGPTTSQLSILNAIKNANYLYRNTSRQAYIIEALETALEVFKELSEPSVSKDSVRRCLILVTQSIPIQNIWAKSSQDSILQDLKTIGVQMSVVSAHKLMELYRLFESAGGEHQNLALKNYSNKPQHLVLLNGFTLQERAVSPSLISQAVSNISSSQPQMGIGTSGSIPSTNNIPTPSPSHTHSGSPGPLQQQQPNQVVMVRPSIGMSQMPSSPAMSNPQQVASLRPNNQLMNPQSQTMNARPRWPMGGGNPMAQNLQPMQQMAQSGPQSQMQQMAQSVPPQQMQQMAQSGPPQQMQQMVQAGSQNQNPQMTSGNLQPVACGVGVQMGPMNRPVSSSRTASPTIIWQGTLEWSEKKQVGGATGGNALQRIPCKISSQPINGKMSIKTDGWPSTLQMLLVQKDLLRSVGNTFFQNTYKVMFLMEPCPALESLNASLTQEYAGCVHLASSNSEVKMIILLFTPDKRAYVGFIPYEQNAFVVKIKQVFQTQSRNLQSQNMNKQNVGQSPQVGVAGSSGQASGVSSSPNIPMISNVSNVPGMMMQQQNQMTPNMPQGGMVGGQVVTNQMGGNGGQGPPLGMGAQVPPMNMSQHLPQGGPMGNTASPTLGGKMVRPAMPMSGQQQQPVDQMQIRQPMHPSGLRQQMQMQQRPAMQVNIGGQPRMMQSQMRQLLQQQRLQQHQMLMIQQQGMRPQMNQPQQGMAQDGTTDYMDLL